MKPDKDYLGDAVYAEADDFGGVWLTTEDGISVTNKIYLEDFVIKALEGYIERMRVAKEVADEKRKRG